MVSKIRENEILNAIGRVLREKRIKCKVAARGVGKKKSEIYVDSKHIKVVKEILKSNGLENSIEVLDNEILRVENRNGR